MKNKKIIYSSLLVGGLVGMGLLLHYLFKEENAIEQRNVPAGIPLPSNATSPVMPHVTKRQMDEPLDQQPIPSPLLVEKEEAQDTPIARKQPEPLSHVHMTSMNDDFPLHIGSKGPRVERLKIWLMRNYGWTGVITDEYDEHTARQVNKYLRKQQVDEKTYKRLDIGRPVYERPGDH